LTNCLLGVQYGPEIEWRSKTVQWTVLQGGVARRECAQYINETYKRSEFINWIGLLGKNLSLLVESCDRFQVRPPYGAPAPIRDSKICRGK